MTVLETLTEYRKLLDEERDIQRKISKYTHNRTLKDKLLEKYTVVLNDKYGFEVYYSETGYGYYKYIPLKDLEEIENLTGSKMVKMNHNIYTFQWLSDKLEEFLCGDMNEQKKDTQ
ncbi:MAG: hypothetical protein IJH63_00880 [Methanobrevibacter sp.]|nr:hypothetical protein [Methanosphaera sp.]MBR0369259.1 hypothetical protein [Methanobrevibacter sp.]